MSDEGEKTCPLCAEEMDLTDQQLRPCKCGYDICVWCWHHIMDMAEKDDTEGRCPACRTPYNKEKIVGTASKCERLVAEMSVEKKQKSLKGKTRTSEGRKQLSSVRVIQRNLVYIVGLPLNLADEDILQRKEYFGQYGKVVKVSISRTAAGSIQHFANNTCSVYITYSKEDEAVRSIQAVHGFVLEGRPLRACFGTTKYCHAWLRNMPCTNPECLYLHEFGSQEDSFTKDEIISEYTRGRVQQVSGGTNDIQRRSGNILPPATATDDYTSCSWPKPPTNDTTTSMKSSPPSSSSGTSVAWGTHVSSNGPPKQKVDNHSEEESKPESATSAINTHLSTPSPRDKKEANISTSETYSYRDKDLDVSNLSSAMSSLDISRNPSNKPNPIPTMDNNNINRLLPDFQNNNNNIIIINKVEEEEVVAVSEAETEADLLSFNHQRLSDPQLVTHTNYLPQSSSSHLNDYSPFGNHDRGSLFNMPVANNVNVNGDSFFQGSNGHSYFPPSNTGGGGGSSKMANNYNNGSIDSGENNMISNILSMDFDPWDDSLTSPQNLSKLLHNNQTSPQILSRKTNQSRFSFAREEDQGSNFTQNLHNNGFSAFKFEESPSSKISVSRSQISAPPGFMGPTRAPPPGFTSNERIIQHASYDNLSGNHMYDTSSSSSSILRKPHRHHQAPVYNSEIELMDPAILAIGTATTSRDMFPSSHHHHHHHHHGSFENDNRLRLLMQTSFSHQNQRFSELENGYGVSSRIPESSSYQNGFQQQPRMSNNGHWDSWNEVQNRNGNGNGNAIAELLRNERLGFNKYYSGL